MPKLSLSMIVRNEEATLGHCLASVRELVDEIVIIDTGSRDRTPEIAESFGAILGHFAWCDDFAEARNHSLRLCTGDWVLVLDADEAIDSQDHACIREAIRQERASAFRITLRNYLPSGDLSTVGVPATPNRSSYQEGMDFGYYADSQGLRLCRRLPGLGFRGRIHELLDPFFEAEGLSIDALPAVIHHFGKLHLARENHKASYYLQLAESEARREPGNFQIQFNLLQQALVAQAWPMVHATASRCLQLRAGVPSLVLLGEAVALQELGRPREALPFLDRVLEAEPTNAPALLRKAVSLAHSGELARARGFFNQAIDAQPGYLLPYLNLSELEKLAGDPAAARAALCAGLTQAPGDPALLDALVKLSVECRDLAQVLEDCLLALSRRPDGGSGLWHRLAALGHAKNGEIESAERILDEGLRRFPGDAELARLRRSLI
jgi:tetratricopeptide (TPR) repeat protein